MMEGLSKIDVRKTHDEMEESNHHVRYLNEREIEEIVGGDRLVGGIVAGLKVCDFARRLAHYR